MSYAESNVEPLRADIAPGWTDWSHNGTAFLGSLVIHALLLVVLALAPVLVRSAAPRVVMMAAAILEEPEQTLTIAEEFAPSDQQLPDIGANSDAGAATALATAPIVAEVSAVPNPVDIPIVSVGEIVVNNEIQLATGLRVENLAVRGHAGVGVTGAMGAIDRITKEILLSLEERRTLVVWFFDKSGSLNRQRQQVYDRFERIYQELGVIEAAGNPAFRRHADKPLLTSVVAFGQQVQFLIDKPTDNIAEIKAAVAEIEQDVSGLERTFSAVHSAAERYRKFRQDSPARNVLFIVFTDEVGNDQEGLDRTVNLCRRLEIPVYVVGTPAPFGQRTVQVKWVDPDPSYDQSPQWPEVDQGPESLFPEVVQLPFLGGDDPQPLDSGFGPYALTRLCYETGGMYFAVHPNRNTSRRLRQSEIDDYSAYFKHFFDPEVMRKYRPDYLAREEYLRQVGKSRLRSSLLRAAEVSDAGQLTTPNRRFVKSDEAAFTTALTEAQKAAAVLEPRLNALYALLQQGEKDRPQEIEPRWQAGFDLAIGRVMAARVRAQGYNAMLAAAKRGLKFADEKNNTWVLNPADEISTGSQLSKAAQAAEEYLERVVREHPETPWAMLAALELRTPLGWKWSETFTDLAPRVAAAGNNNNNNNRPPPTARPLSLPKPPPKRSPPKL